MSKSYEYDASSITHSSISGSSAIGSVSNIKYKPMTPETIEFIATGLKDITGSAKPAKESVANMSKKIVPSNEWNKWLYARTHYQVPSAGSTATIGASYITAIKKNGTIIASVPGRLFYTKAKASLEWLSESTPGEIATLLDTSMYYAAVVREKAIVRMIKLIAKEPPLESEVAPGLFKVGGDFAVIVGKASPQGSKKSKLQKLYDLLPLGGLAAYRLHVQHTAFYAVEQGVFKNLQTQIPKALLAGGPPPKLAVYVVTDRESDYTFQDAMQSSWQTKKPSYLAHLKKFDVAYVVILGRKGDPVIVHKLGEANPPDFSSLKREKLTASQLALKDGFAVVNMLLGKHDDHDPYIYAYAHGAKVTVLKAITENLPPTVTVRVSCNGPAAATYFKSQGHIGVSRKNLAFLAHRDLMVHDPAIGHEIPELYADDNFFAYRIRYKMDAKFVSETTEVPFERMLISGQSTDEIGPGFYLHREYNGKYIITLNPRIDVAFYRQAKKGDVLRYGSTVILMNETLHSLLASLD